MDKPDQHEIYLSYYGDDFTGSTDVMESLTLNGLPAALFLQPPGINEINNFRFKNSSFPAETRLRAFGVAGVSRSMTPDQMNEELPHIFKKISKIRSRFFHYKVCSTFDSSPEIGNIGHAIDLALKYFPSQYVPLIVGAPDLNRFCVFGNLFARVDTTTYRLDRHPTMSKHPITPMNESDLRLHLKNQTNRDVHLLDILTIEDGDDEIEKILQQTKDNLSAPFLLIDIINKEHLVKAGKVMLLHSNAENQLLVGSSGVENALTAYLQDTKVLSRFDLNVSVGQASKMLVMAGSCSPITHKQIDWAINAGFERIRIDSEKLVDPDTREQEILRVVLTATQLLHHKHVVVFTALGPEDEAIAKTHTKLKALTGNSCFPADYLAKIQGQILYRILEEHSDARVTVAGGDTSGHVAKALGIYALEVLTPIAPGAPLCIAHSKNKKFDGLEIALKGGQCGDENYFESIYMGTNQRLTIDPVLLSIQ
ncbi:Hrp-dependent type III effector protein [Flammeovirgaceae bacterium 311]|nr:Hrp-dependent type III effector protein [Flammeovirgaceae bacterium 311]